MKKPNRYVFLNNRFCDVSHACVSVQDHGFLYGDGIYETIRMRQGKIFLWTAHTKRLRQSARGIGLSVPISSNTLKNIVLRLCKKNHLMEAVVRITLTRGIGPNGFDPRLCEKPTLVITADPFQPYPAWYPSRGIRVAVVSIRRNSPSALPPTIKSTSCLNGILAKRESLRYGAQEGLMLSGDGYLAEGTVSNVFLVKNSVLITPKRDGRSLLGVTQEYVMRLARRKGWQVKEKLLTMNDFKSADEIFLSNTTMDVMPVHEVIWADTRHKKHRFSFPVGPISRQLRLSFVR